jgi:hypothetical protein
MAYDFKRLGDVDFVDAPAKNANVLIEENGIIKKVSRNSISGCDAMLVFENLNYDEYGTFTIGNYQILHDKINALKEVTVLVGTKQVRGFDEGKTIFRPIQYSLKENLITVVV